MIGFKHLLIFYSYLFYEKKVCFLRRAKKQNIIEFFTKKMPIFFKKECCFNECLFLYVKYPKYNKEHLF